MRATVQSTINIQYFTVVECKQVHSLKYYFIIPVRSIVCVTFTDHIDKFAYRYHGRTVRHNILIMFLFLIK